MSFYYKGFEDIPWEAEEWHGYKYFTNRHTDGGAWKWHNQILMAVCILGGNKKWKRALDWGAGDGGLGMALLGENLVDHCTFMDHYQEACNRCNYNLEYNKITNAEVICENRVKNLTCDKFDLVIANPPHHRICELYKMYDIGWLKPNVYSPQNYKKAKKQIDKDKPHRHFDFNWQTHIDFYQDIADYLEDGADLMMFENGQKSNPLHWEWGDLPKGLEIVQWVDSSHIPTLEDHYVLHLKYKI